MIEKKRDRYHSNIEKSREIARIKQRTKRKNIDHRLKSNISWYLWRFSKKGGIGTSKIIEEKFGYSISDLKIHIEKQFLKGMSWGNYGRDGWHIDHIIPMRLFNAEDEAEFRNCWSLSNLRPMWAKDNKIKNGKAEYLL